MTLHLGRLKTYIEFDLFGMGKEVGNTAFRLRHAYAELGKFGVGQTNSLFTDIGSLSKYSGIYGAKCNVLHFETYKFVIPQL